MFYPLGSAHKFKSYNALDDCGEGLSATSQAECVRAGQRWRLLGMRSCRHDPQDMQRGDLSEVTGDDSPLVEPYVSACDDPCAPASSSPKARAMGVSFHHHN